jgi:hypothetical protein
MGKFESINNFNAAFAVLILWFKDRSFWISSPQCIEKIFKYLWDERSINIMHYLSTKISTDEISYKKRKKRKNVWIVSFCNCQNTIHTVFNNPSKIYPTFWTNLITVFKIFIFFGYFLK